MEIRILEKLDNILKLLKGEQVQDGFMDINGVVKYSAMSKSAIRNACRLGLLKYNNSQGKHLFKKSSVETWLNNSG